MHSEVSMLSLEEFGEGSDEGLGDTDVHPDDSGSDSGKLESDSSHNDDHSWEAACVFTHDA